MIQKKLKEARQELQRRLAKKKAAEESYIEIKNEVARLERFAQQANKPIKVTDHAIVRYLERAGGLDIDRIKKRILSKETENLVKTLGNGKYPLNKNKLVAVVENNIVVTVKQK